MSIYLFLIEGGYGGGSFNGGRNQFNTAASNAGNGQVVISPAFVISSEGSGGLFFLLSYWFSRSNLGLLVFILGYIF